MTTEEVVGVLRSISKIAETDAALTIEQTIDKLVHIEHTKKTQRDEYISLLPDLSMREILFLKASRKFRAIMEYRTRTGESIRDARDKVEAYSEPSCTPEEVNK